jgi:hypothetical protein
MRLSEASPKHLAMWLLGIIHGGATLLTYSEGRPRCYRFRDEFSS